jgi:predicted enzyme related to lactoylglutathione lyase
MALTMKPVASRSQVGETEFSLQECPAVAELPAADIDRARRFYAEQLGLTSSPGAAPGLYIYQCAGSRFLLYQTGVRASGTHDQMAFMVPDLRAVVRQLKARGVVFEIVDEPGAVGEESGSHSTAEIAETEHRRSAWFKDSEGNLINLTEILSCVLQAHGDNGENQL